MLSIHVTAFHIAIVWNNSYLLEKFWTKTKWFKSSQGKGVLFRIKTSSKWAKNKLPSMIWSSVFSKISECYANILTSIPSFHIRNLIRFYNASQQPLTFAGSSLEPILASTLMRDMFQNLNISSVPVSKPFLHLSSSKQRPRQVSSYYNSTIRSRSSTWLIHLEQFGDKFMKWEYLLRQLATCLVSKFTVLMLFLFNKGLCR